MVEVTRRLSIQRAYICPRRPMQNYAEGYLGRITAMASFAMVYAGAPLLMWIYSVKAATFTNNIAAKYYRLKDAWAQPYQVVHGETFADSSIVVPFGCGALILRDSDDRPKFHSKCTLMIFLHYADEHPMFTYAFFSPRTKRVLYRQDAIFLPTLFPMRLARQASGLEANGEALTTFRSPASLRDGSPPELSFGNWSDSDPLPNFEDDVTGFSLGPPSGPLVHEPREIPELPVHIPNHPGFGPSAVVVPIPASSMIGFQSTDRGASVSSEARDGSLPDTGDVSRPRRSGRNQKARSTTDSGKGNVGPSGLTKRLVRDRWSYENVLSSTPSDSTEESSPNSDIGTGNSDAVGPGSGSVPSSLPPSLLGDQQSSDTGMPPPAGGPPPPPSVVANWTGPLVLVFGLDSLLLFQMEKNATNGTLPIQGGLSLSLRSGWRPC